MNSLAAYGKSGKMCPHREEALCGGAESNKAECL